MKLVLSITLPAAAVTSFASYRPEPSLLLCAAVGFCLNWVVLGIALLCSRGKAPVRPGSMAHAFLAMVMVGMMFDVKLDREMRKDVVGMVAVP